MTVHDGMKSPIDNIGFLFAISLPFSKISGMGVILGVIFHFIGGFASGSFYMPFKKVKGWAWESYWIVGGLF
jgi:L-rhamnose-H+ transport protein